MRNFSEIFRKDVTYDNIKSHEKPGLQPLSRRYIFEKNTGGGGEGVKVENVRKLGNLRGILKLGSGTAQ